MILNEELSEKVYVEQPESFVQKGSENKIYKLQSQSIAWNKCKSMEQQNRRYFQ